MKRNQSGFTLIEIAIVLVIIGLLLGGILKGQELINSAKVKNLATDFRNVPVYVYGYQDKFKALPGDDKNADTHLGPTANCAGGACPAVVATAGNGVIDGAWNSVTATDESFLFWQHVRLAGLATGATALTDPTYLPTNAVGGTIGIQSGTAVLANTPIKDKSGAAIRGTYIICSTGILGKFVKQLDTQMDDGATDTGSMLATPTAGYALGAVALSSTAATWDDAAPYNVCMGV